MNLPMKSLAGVGVLVFLFLAIGASPAFAQNGGKSGQKKRLEGKVSRNFTKAEGPKIAKRKIDFAPIVADPKLAAELAEAPPRILTPDEYRDLIEERRSRLKTRTGRSLASTERDWSEAYDGESAKRDKLVKNEDVGDDSLKFLLWLIGGVSTVGLAFYFWRRHL